jgi:hypothetical protein
MNLAFLSFIRQRFVLGVNFAPKRLFLSIIQHIIDYIKAVVEKELSNSEIQVAPTRAFSYYSKRWPYGDFFTRYPHTVFYFGSNYAYINLIKGSYYA